MISYLQTKISEKLFNFNAFIFPTQLQSKVKEFGKYSATSLLSTIADYSAFYFLLLSNIPSVAATFFSHIVGSIIAFILLVKWVFQFTETEDVRPLVLKFFGAQSASLLLNTTGFWLLFHFTHSSTWMARISAAVFVWVLMYFVNKFFVFKH